MAVYTERVRCVLGAHKFLMPASKERLNKCVIMPRHIVVLAPEEGGQRKRGMDLTNDSVQMTHAAKHQVGAHPFCSSGESGLLQPEIMVSGAMQESRQIYPFHPSTLNYPSTSRTPNSKTTSMISCK